MTKILIIEDNKDNLDLMVYLFNQFGYLTVTALDGEEGVAIAKNESPDLIICDIQLPKLNGYEVVKILKNDHELQHIPIVAVTAYAMVGDQEKIRTSGFNAYIPKPINPAHFVLEIESLLPEKLRINKQFNLQAIPKKEKLPPINKCGSALIVANYLPNRELFKNILEKIGFDVVDVENVRDALAAIQKNIPDLILSDVDLPDISGLDFLRLVRQNEQWKLIPFIIMSATEPTKKAIQEINMLNVNRFILLPIDPNIFMTIVKSICSEIKK